MAIETMRSCILLLALSLLPGCAWLASATGVDEDTARSVGVAAGETLKVVGGLASGTPYGVVLVLLGGVVVAISKTRKDR